MCELEFASGVEWSGSESRFWIGPLGSHLLPLRLRRTYCVGIDSVKGRLLDENEEEEEEEEE